MSKKITKRELVSECLKEIGHGNQLFNELHKCRQDVQRLREACEAALLLADADGDLPDNGEYHGGAIADQIRCALEDTRPAGITPHSKDG